MCDTLLYDYLPQPGFEDALCSIGKTVLRLLPRDACTFECRSVLYHANAPRVVVLRGPDMPSVVEWVGTIEGVLQQE